MSRCNRPTTQIRLCTLLLVLCAGVFLSPAFGAGLTAVGPQHSLKLQTPASYIPGIPLLVRLEVFQPDGHRAWDVWDADATLSSPTPGVMLSTNRLHLYNGLGSILVLVTNSGDFELVATVGSQQTNRTILCKTNATVTTVSGALSGTTTWSGIIKVTGDVTNSGTLIIEPDTWVLLNGVTSGSGGTDIEIRGTLLAQGTEEQPITFTSSTNGYNWGELRHTSGSFALYRHALINKGGRSPGGGHTGAGCLLRLSSCTNVYEDCSLTDATTVNHDTMGKTMTASSSSVTFSNCLLGRCVMGPETTSTGLQCMDTYFLEMLGSPAAPQGINDNDAIYPHGNGGKPILFRDCVFARTQDDGIDTLDADVDVDNCIVRNCDNMAEDSKGVSVYGGEVRLRNCLIVDNKCGVSGKDEAAVTIRMDHCTVVALVEYALGAQDKSGSMRPIIDFRVTNSIFRTLNPLTNSVYSAPTATNYNPLNLHLYFCDTGEAWPGATNSIVGDPLLVSIANHDYHLQPSSPCRNAGDPASPLDSDGTVTDMGYQFPFTYVAPPRLVVGPANGEGLPLTIQGDIGQIYLLENSSDLLPAHPSWTTWMTLTNSTGEVSCSDPSVTNLTQRFYRVRAQ